MGPQLAEFVIDGHEIATYITEPRSAPEVGFILNEIFGDNDYFKHGIDIRPGDVVIDVGANIGLFGAKALSSVPGGDITYIGIEPCPNSFEALKLNLCGTDSKGLEASFFHINPEYAGPITTDAAATSAAEGRTCSPYPGNLQLINKAVSSTPGTQTITYYPAMPGNSTLRPTEKRALQAALMPPAVFKGAQLLQVTVITLDQLLEVAGLAGQPVGILKVDVEGEELEVLKGLNAENWRQLQQVVMEVHDCIEGEFAAASAAAAAAACLPDLPGQRGSGIDGNWIRYINTGDSGRAAAAAAAAGAAMAAAAGASEQEIAAAVAAIRESGSGAVAAGGASLPPPRDDGRVMAVAEKLKGLGFKVVIEPMRILVKGKPLNYMVYARRAERLGGDCGSRSSRCPEG